jgi:hypothetical protein
MRQGSLDGIMAVGKEDVPTMKVMSEWLR